MRDASMKGIEKNMGRIIMAAVLLSLLMPVAPARASTKSEDRESLKQYVGSLKKTPRDDALRGKIITMALGMKPAPSVPEEAERNMARGTAFAQRASDPAGYKKAIAEFEAASDTAPWLALAYYNLGVMQEKAGLYNEAIRSLKLYLMAAPHAKNAREVKNHIYGLEVDAEDMQAGKNAAAAAPPSPAPPSGTGAGKSITVAAATELAIEPEKQLKIIKMPQDKKSKVSVFIGSWYFKEQIRGEDVTIHAFDIEKNSNGDLVLTPPKRTADSYASVNIFEIADKKLKVQMKWKMKSVVGYWKTETYDLVMSDDGSRLAGSHNQQSVGGRNIDMDRTLFRQ